MTGTHTTGTQLGYSNEVLPSRGEARLHDQIASLSSETLEERNKAAEIEVHVKKAINTWATPGVGWLSHSLPNFVLQTITRSNFQ